jgi:hypothetical protein
MTMGMSTAIGRWVSNNSRKADAHAHQHGRADQGADARCVPPAPGGLVDGVGRGRAVFALEE